MKSLVSLISGSISIEIEPTDGSDTIWGSERLFTGYLDKSFEYLKREALPTKKTPVQVYKVIEDGTYTMFFRGVSQDLESLCLTQHQIKRFALDHSLWFQDRGRGTFFLFKSSGKFMVMRVDLISRGPYALLYPLSCNYLWDAGARHRLVVPRV